MIRRDRLAHIFRLRLGCEVVEDALLLIRLESVLPIDIIGVAFENCFSGGNGIGELFVLWGGGCPAVIDYSHGICSLFDCLDFSTVVLFCQAGKDAVNAL